MADKTVKSGIILPWFVSVADVPSGYVVCDGSNGTPNLKDRVVPKDDSPHPRQNPPAYIMKT